jgi:RHS repeat-associated protein
MQLSSDVQIPNGMLAAIALRNEKPRLGVPSRNPALHQGIDASNSTIVLGLQSTAALNRIGSRCTGKERDSESGNDYFGARYYASSMGRFMSPDWSAQVVPVPYAKLGDPQSLNLYAYVRNNPLYMIDPDGHGWWKDFGNGLADSTYRPLVQVAKHPIATAQGIGNAAMHPIATGGAIGHAIGSTISAAAHGDGRAIGQIVGTVGTAVAGGAIARGVGAGAQVGSFVGESTSVVASQVDNLPGAVARVISADIQATTLGAPGAADVFVTDANAIRGMNSSQIANGLTISGSPSGFNVIEFPTPNGIASPINRMNPGFVGGGQTTGGLPEYVVPNGPIPANATITHVP